MIPAKLTTIGPSAFENTKLTGLDLSEATSLVDIGACAFYGTVLGGTLVIPFPAKLTTIGPSAFHNTPSLRASTSRTRPRSRRSARGPSMALAFRARS